MGITYNHDPGLRYQLLGPQCMNHWPARTIPLQQQAFDRHPHTVMDKMPSPPHISYILLRYWTYLFKQKQLHRAPKLTPKLPSWDLTSRHNQHTTTASWKLRPPRTPLTHHRHKAMSQSVQTINYEKGAVDENTGTNFMWLKSLFTIMDCMCILS